MSVGPRRSWIRLLVGVCVGLGRFTAKGGGDSMGRIVRGGGSTATGGVGEGGWTATSVDWSRPLLVYQSQVVGYLPVRPGWCPSLRTPYAVLCRRWTGASRGSGVGMIVFVGWDRTGVSWAEAVIEFRLVMRE